MTLKNKKICIWGYGATGRAAARFAHQREAQVTVMDHAPQSDCPWPCIRENETSHRHLLAESDLIIPSPGIDIRPYYAKYKHKWLAELDLFAQYNTTHTIAITGSLGKTSVISLLSDLLPKYGLSVKTGGNIGTPMLDLLDGKKADHIMLEVSSFQLEYTKLFAPDVAAITNIHENHLDRHGSMEHYAKAKSQIFARQKASQIAIVPLEYADTIRPHTGTATLHAISPHNVNIDDLPSITFRDNWLTIARVLTTLGLPLAPLASYARDLHVPPHRLESVPFRPGILVYNDSKSTTPAATQAALKQLNHPNIILFLGGLSKGVDRTPLVAGLAGQVTQVYCFGTEADILNMVCRTHNIKSYSFATLDKAWRHCATRVHPGNSVILSPGGSSFDLFGSYQERGDHFKQLVTQSR